MGNNVIVQVAGCIGTIILAAIIVAWLEKIKGANNGRYRRRN